MPDRAEHRNGDQLRALNSALAPGFVGGDFAFEGVIAKLGGGGCAVGAFALGGGLAAAAGAVHDRAFDLARVGSLFPLGRGAGGELAGGAVGVVGAWGSSDGPALGDAGAAGPDPDDVGVNVAAAA